jgi:hypothetical protein
MSKKETIFTIEKDEVWWSWRVNCKKRKTELMNSSIDYKMEI